MPVCSCPYCGVKLSFRVEDADKHFTCPHCAGLFNPMSGGVRPPPKKSDAPPPVRQAGLAAPTAAPAHAAEPATAKPHASPPRQPPAPPAGSDGLPDFPGPSIGDVAEPRYYRFAEEGAKLLTVCWIFLTIVLAIGRLAELNSISGKDDKGAWLVGGFCTTVLFVGPVILAIFVGLALVRVAVDAARRLRDIQRLLEK